MLAIAIASAFLALASAAPTSIVQTTNGPIVGYLDNGIPSFKGIPYGADTSTTRFKAPKHPSPWNTTKQCTSWGPTAPQPWSGSRSGPNVSEDCLNLNVWTPALDNKKRPVVVYFHGGGYDSLTNNDDTYDGMKLAKKRDVVVITVNHRINGFGYLYLGGVSPEFRTGNPGQMDLILGLKWVRNNIAKFGGNKDNVLIFGQSGGGAKCATLMAMPEAKGLFHRVWTMSGQQITGRTLEHAGETASDVFKKLNGTDLEKIKELETMPMDELRRVLSAGSGWTPVVDGNTLPRDPFYPTANEQSMDIPMVIGNTYDETRNLIGNGRPKLFNLQWEDVPSAIESNVKQFIGNKTGADIVRQYRARYPQYSPSDVFFAACTAARSWKSMVVESDIRVKQRNSPTWVYYLRWKSPYRGGKYGAAHGFDIPLVFANTDGLKETKDDASAAVLAEIMSKALAHFAKTGEPKIIQSEPAPEASGTTPFKPWGAYPTDINPNLIDNSVPPRLEDLQEKAGLAELEWPRYELKERMSMIFDRDLTVHSDDRGWERQFFADAPYVQPGT